MRRLALAALMTAAPAAAQTDGASPGAAAEIAVGGVFASQPFGEAWTVEPGLVGRFALPLHGGTAELTLRGLPFDGSTLPDSTAEAPDFLLVGTTVGWGPTLRLGPAEATPLVRVGVVQFRFDPEDDQFQAQLTNETEAAVGLALRVAVPVGRVAVWAEGEALRIALRDPETVASVSAGLALRFGLPPVLRDLLDE